MLDIRNIVMETWNADVHPSGLRSFDNVKLVALSTCPTFGIVRYDHHKTYKSAKRNMALETGTACHEAFAAVRLADLYMFGNEFYEHSHPELDMRDVALNRMVALHGEERAAQWQKVLESGEDYERAIMLCALDAFGSSAFYDDPEDNRRTTPNIEEALIVYVGKYPLGKRLPVVQQVNDYLFVGVEISVDTYLRIETDDEAYEYNFTGRIDGVLWHDDAQDFVEIEDDKTTSRLGDGWRQQWAVAHQMTGYCIAATCLLGKPVTRGKVRGLAIPIPKTYDYGGCIEEPFHRDERAFEDWARWLIHTDLTTREYVDTPTRAPMFTHSCFRYFSVCPMLMYCDSPIDEREAMLEEMDVERWSPLEEPHD